MASNYSTFELGFLGDFEDLENVSEMVAETLETSKDQQSESATIKTKRARARVAKSAASENNTCTYLRLHVQNLQFDQFRKSDFSA